MPYIDVKVTATLDASAKIKLKEGLGRIITLIPGKTEAVTMIGLIGGYDLYMDGKPLQEGAYVEVKAYKEVPREYKEAVNAGIFELLDSVLSIRPENIYVTFFDQNEWGSHGVLR